MKIKTSITLSEDLLTAIDERSQQFKNRSGFIEEAVRSFLAQIHKQEVDAKDLAILNKHAERLNQEAEDVLGYQLIP
ncbi:MAG: ribbon-helix-helix domain-containing protein [Candidatus Hydrogenedentes bacterium]|nr:ribbon-helix-helix domain-containing protein [Candidatus Hydrogenedentota bacterium]